MRSFQGVKREREEEHAPGPEAKKAKIEPTEGEKVPFFLSSLNLA